MAKRLTIEEKQKRLDDWNALKLKKREEKKLKKQKRLDDWNALKLKKREEKKLKKQKSNNPLVKSKERVKELGEVFTPPALVNEMLDKLPPDSWLPEKTFLEPSCGTGNFLVEILRRKLKAGHSPSQACSTIYGVDIMEDNIKESRRRLMQIVLDNTTNEYEIVIAFHHIMKNIRQGNTLTDNLGELFGMCSKNDYYFEMIGERNVRMMGV